MSIYENAQALAKSLISRFKNPNGLRFQEEIKATDGMGGYESAWVDKFRCDGALIPLASVEQMKSMQLQDKSTHEAYIEFSSGTPTYKDRLIFKGKLYNVTGVLNIAEADAAYIVFLAGDGDAPTPKTYISDAIYAA